MGIIGKDKPYLKFYKMTKEGTWEWIYNSEISQSHKPLLPTWPNLKFTSFQLFDDDLKNKIKIEVRNKSDKVKDKIYDVVEFTMSDIKDKH